MLTGFVVARIVQSAELFAQCFRAELDRAQTPQLMRAQLAILFDNAMLRYVKQRDDAATVAAVEQLRPKIRFWLTGSEN